jgi:hypothetical protein
MYAYIIEAELLFLLKFKINPYELLQKISLLDLFTYIKLLETKIKKEHDSINKNDITKSLVALRDILIFMTMGKDGLRMRN